MKRTFPFTTMLVLFVGLMATGCHKKQKREPAESLPARDALKTGAEQATRQFFTAVEANDCPSVLLFSSKKSTTADCQDFIRHWNGAQMKFLGIVDSTIDGRNHRAIIVKTRVQKRSRKKTTLVRVLYNKGKWLVQL